jgi:hypothetical protein
MVRRRVSAVSNHEGPVGESIPSTTERYGCGADKSTTADIGIPQCSFAGLHPSRRGEDAAPQDKEIEPVMTCA